MTRVRLSRRWARALTTCIVTFAGLLVAEAILRSVDGFQILSVPLRASPPGETARRTDSPDRRYAAAVPRPDAVRLEWYDQRPDTPPRIPLTPELQRRADQYPTEPWAPFFEWNLTYLREQACTPNRDVVMGGLRDFHYFTSLGGSRYPTYRHMRRVSPPGWFVTNGFGWRGPDIPLNKLPGTIRIAFVGASTTVSAFGVPFSHPELVGYWLNWWAATKGWHYRFEVINAGRMGINSNSIAAIVDQELVPLEPDLVVYYEGANQFWPDRLVRVDNAVRLEPPKSTYVKRTILEDYFALVRRALHVVDRAQGLGGYEPHKPASQVMFPEGVSESDPDVDSPKLPMDLPNIVASLDQIRTSLSAIDGELVVSSFVWIVYPNMRLDLSRDLTLYNYLNRVFWPYTYAEMRRLADYQNRVFERYARARGVPFIDVAAEYPQDPALASDAVHLRYEGLSLQAWIYLQKLIPIIEERVASGRLPKPMRVSRTAHPGFAEGDPRLLTLEELREQCP